jgi:CHC2 zinc finger/Toprim domain
MIADLAVRARSVPILSELDRRGVKLRRSGAEWIGPCPRCGGRDRFSVNSAKAIFHCRRSGAGGDVIDLVQYLDEVDFASAARMLKEGVAPAHVPPADAGAEHRQHSLAHDDWAHQRALDLWREAVPIEGTPAEMYLRGVRALQIPEGVSGSVLRFHPACIFGHSVKHPCLLALFRSIATNEPMAIVRTALRADATKIDRKSLGPVRGAAIKLSADIVITSNLVIGEGLETVLAGMRLGFAPAWVLGCAGAIAKFSVLGDVEVLTILVDHDEAGMRAAAECSARWTAAGHTVHRIVPRREGQDMADLV